MDDHERGVLHMTRPMEASKKMEGPREPTAVGWRDHDGIEMVDIDGRTYALNYVREAIRDHIRPTTEPLAGPLDALPRFGLCFTSGTGTPFVGEKSDGAYIKRDEAIQALHPVADTAALDALREAREFVDVVAGENKPSHEWAHQLRKQIDAALSHPAVAKGGDHE